MGEGEEGVKHCIAIELWLSSSELFKWWVVHKTTIGEDSFQPHILDGETKRQMATLLREWADALEKKDGC